MILAVVLTVAVLGLFFAFALCVAARNADRAADRFFDAGGHVRVLRRGDVYDWQEDES